MTAGLKHPEAKKLRAAALAYPTTVEDFPWGDRAFKVGGNKVFLFLSDAEGGGWSCSMKLPFRAEEALKVKGAEPTGYGLGRAGWVSFRFAAKQKAPMTKMLDWLDESWRAIAPKKLSEVQPAPAPAKKRGGGA
ncbi:MAG: MmcQ/YjbR family DNA-binding protein [Terricaulis sp.]